MRSATPAPSSMPCLKAGLPSNPDIARKGYGVTPFDSRLAVPSRPLSDRRTRPESRIRFRDLVFLGREGRETGRVLTTGEQASGSRAHSEELPSSG